jgi:DNA-binding transcriptional MocR family regulator
VRLCLGSPSDEGLERALRRLARILGSPEEMLAV